MGIPRLIATLEPYSNQHKLQNEEVVIDGPALAYHVSWICRQSGHSYPSSALLQQVVLQWLDALADQGIKIEAIYFDGFLPPAKRPTRMERMIKSAGQLNQLYAVSSNIYAQICSQGKNVILREDMFQAKAPLTEKVPAPTFLVPAVLDVLRDSSAYAAMVHVVPGEADAVCAKHLADHGGTVLTSDSDLLIHDLGSGKVAFLRDMHTQGDESDLLCNQYEPKEIRQRLGLEKSNLVRFGYELSLAPHSTVSQLVRKCETQDVDSVHEFEHFCEEYIHAEASKVPLTPDQQGTLPIKNLDPRLSELAVQLGNGPREPEVFLPISLDNPMRESAWVPCSWLRQVAYTLLAHLIGSKCTAVSEYRRVQRQQQQGKLLDIMSPDELQKAITHLENAGIWPSPQVKGFSKPARYLSLLTMDPYDPDDTRVPHARRILEQAALRTLPQEGQEQWNVVHLTAQVQAYAYSIRMVKQVLSMCDAACWDSIISSSGPTKHQAVADAIGSIAISTSLEDVPDLRAIRHYINSLHEPDKKAEVQSMLNLTPEQFSALGNTRKKKRKTSKEARDGKPKKMSRPSLSSNSFSILQDE
ncbi:XPG domain containing-domain-containing protein [Emericellopsis atlantica]|uniref:XPG domain containing-domain-containing protein n=1 Tax=Emericellopsis atlantica TaxID=2614577 RepID=A0A9P7ZH47_9HYPO|nr:XPG domain containing-domain-containing protein [Emericellopsis atlantica]KAG9251831.1 XPG domain containing-domain-containing protein [Emericellopsis atlantica]